MSVCQCLLYRLNRARQSIELLLYGGHVVLRVVSLSAMQRFRNRFPSIFPLTLFGIVTSAKYRLSTVLSTIVQRLHGLAFFLALKKRTTKKINGLILRTPATQYHRRTPPRYEITFFLRATKVLVTAYVGIAENNCVLSTTRITYLPGSRKYVAYFIKYIKKNNIK